MEERIIKNANYYQLRKRMRQLLTEVHWVKWNDVVQHNQTPDDIRRAYEMTHEAIQIGEELRRREC